MISKGIDKIILKRWIVVAVIIALIVLLLLYILNYIIPLNQILNLKRTIPITQDGLKVGGFNNQHTIAFIFFGIVSVLGFLVAYRVLAQIKPIQEMQEYVEYLTYVLKKTVSGDQVYIIAGSPNPGLSEFVETKKYRKEKENPKHYYHEYRRALRICVRENRSLRYRVLKYHDNDGQISYDYTNPKTPMMKFLKPFIDSLNTDEAKTDYINELKGLLENDLGDKVEESAPDMEENKGFVLISHPRMGFLGVYDAAGGELRVRGVKIEEAIFLDVISEMNSLIHP